MITVLIINNNKQGVVDDRIVGVPRSYLPPTTSNSLPTYLRVTSYEPARVRQQDPDF